MKLLKSVVAVSLVLSLGSAGAAMAVGYERQVVDGKPSSGSKTGPPARPDLLDAIKDASLAQKYPDVLDETVSTVKDILMQFGLADRKDP